MGSHVRDGPTVVHLACERAFHDRRDVILNVLLSMLRSELTRIGFTTDICIQVHVCCLL